MKKIILIFISIILLIVVGIIWKQLMMIKGNKPQVTPSVVEQQTEPVSEDLVLEPREFKFFQMRLGVPEGWEVEDKQVAITLIAPEGEINISRNGIYFDNVAEHLELSDSRKKTLQIISSKIGEVPNQDVVHRIEYYGNNDKTENVYYFYTNYGVISISTQDKKLYDALAQIAQTFEYLRERDQ